MTAGVASSSWRRSSRSRRTDLGFFRRDLPILCGVIPAKAAMTALQSVCHIHEEFNMTTPVSFLSDGLKLCALLHVPPDLKPGERRPAFIVMHGFGGSNQGGQGAW